MTALRLLTLCLAIVVTCAGPARAQDPWFTVDSLNPGLGPVPDRIDRATPQSSMESFLGNAAQGDWAQAAHMLDLSDYPPERQAEVGEALAQDLYTVIQRKIILDWTDLSDRPDALLESAPNNAPLSGEPRKSIRLWIVDMPERPVPVRLNRIRAGEADPVWVISRQSVENLPLLAARYGPTRFEKALPSALRAQSLFGLRVWELIALPLVLAAVVGLGVLVHGLMSRGLLRTRRDSPESLLVSARPPVILAVMTLALALLSRQVFVFSGRIDAVLSPLIATGYVAALLWAVVNLADLILNRLVQFDGSELTTVGDGQERKRAIATRIAAGRRAIIVLVAVFGTGIVLREASVMQSLGFSLIASAGAITLIAAFAARNVLANIMASMQIALNQTARIGDRILYKGALCSVERIHFTYVQLRVWTGVRLVVPVVDFVNEPFENWTMQEPFLIREVDFQLTASADVDALREAYHEILDARDGDTDQRDSRGVFVTEHTVFGKTAMFLVPSTDPNSAWATACEVREKLLVAAARIAEETGHPMLTEAEVANAA